MPVGLNFGSAFSGQGINVSSTVSAILTNLQNIETPWKNQIAKLHSQDTVFSSLGTILSSLSTNLNTLSEPTGILAQKTGSSSNPNALTLTSASNKAVAGTHSINITSLATTSSGVLSKIADADDTLSGSIKIQVGDGDEHTITLKDSNNTLSGLASAINSAGIGVTASVLTDTTGSRLSIVSGNSGDVGVLKISSSIKDEDASGVTLGYQSSVEGANGAISVDGVALTVASNTVSGVIPGVTFQLLQPTATGSPVQVIIANYNTGVENAVEAMVTNYNSLLSAINEQEGYDSSGVAEPLFGSPTLTMLQQDILSGMSASNPNGYMDSLPDTSDTRLSGSITIRIGGEEAQTITLDSSQTTISDLADAINDADIGVNAAVVTRNHESTLTLSSQTAGINGALTVTSAINVTEPSLLKFTAEEPTELGAARGLLGTLDDDSDLLTGSVDIKVGDGEEQTVELPPNGGTLDDLADAINAAGVGVTASVVTSDDGVSSVELVSNTPGTAGGIGVGSELYDMSAEKSKPLNYNFSSNISTMAMLGIQLNNDGTISFDATSLDSLLNTDFNGVQGFFQSAYGWGASFNTLLSNAGSTKTTGMIKLALKSDSSIIATLNGDISREELQISTQQKSLSKEMNSVNEVLTAIPSQISQVNELYSAISGYNKSSS